jgi:hypothetical protein
MNKALRWLGSCAAMTPRDRQNQLRANRWLAAWMGSWLGVNFAISYDVLPRGLPGSLAALLPLCLGVGAILAYRRFLREADELLRKILLDALALSVGVGMLAGFTSYLLVRTGALSREHVLVVISLMMVTYSAAVAVGTRRFS